VAALVVHTRNRRAGAQRGAAKQKRSRYAYRVLCPLFSTTNYIPDVKEDSPPCTTPTTSFGDFRSPDFLSYCS